jgi:hypothetical protein
MSLMPRLFLSDKMIGFTIQVLALVTVSVLVALVLEGVRGKRGAAVRHGIWLCALVSSLLGPLVVLGAHHAGITLATIEILSREPELSGSSTIPLRPADGPRQGFLADTFSSPGH